MVPNKDSLKYFSHSTSSPGSRKAWELVVKFWPVTFRKSHWLFEISQPFRQRLCISALREQIICLLNAKMYNV